jgi:hypothetical protein
MEYMKVKNKFKWKKEVSEVREEEQGSYSLNSNKRTDTFSLERVETLAQSLPQVLLLGLGPLNR